MLENYGNILISFIQKFISLFLESNISADNQQAIKIGILLALMLLFFSVVFLVTKVITNVVKPLTMHLGERVEYLFYSILAFGVFTFTDRVSFVKACWMIILILSISQAYAITKEVIRYIENQKNPHKDISQNN